MKKEILNSAWEHITVSDECIGDLLDRIEDGGQNYAVFSFAEKQSGEESIALKNEGENAFMEACPQNAYSVLIYSSPALKEGIYTLWVNEQQMQGSGGGMMAGGPGMGDMESSQRPEDMPEPPPEGMQSPGSEEETIVDFEMKDGANMFGRISVKE